MAKSVKLSEGARVFRSKNAGPFRSTVDIFYADASRYYKIKQSGSLTPRLVARCMKMPEEYVEGIFYLDQALGIKITLSKHPGMASGEPRCVDTFGCQQYIPLKELVVEIQD